MEKKRNVIGDKGAIFFDTGSRRVVVGLPSRRTVIFYPGNPQRNPITDPRDIEKCRAHGDLYEVVKINRPGGKSAGKRWVRKPDDGMSAQRRGRTITTANFKKDTPAPVSAVDTSGEGESAPVATENLLDKLNDEPPIAAVTESPAEAPAETPAEAPDGADDGEDAATDALTSDDPEVGEGSAPVVTDPAAPVEIKAETTDATETTEATDATKDAPPVAPLVPATPPATKPTGKVKKGEVKTKTKKKAKTKGKK